MRVASRAAHNVVNGADPKWENLSFSRDGVGLVPSGASSGGRREPSASIPGRSGERTLAQGPVLTTERRLREQSRTRERSRIAPVSWLSQHATL